MAYSHPNLQRVGPANSAVPTLWHYSSTDTQATINTSGYFDDASDDLTVGDLIYAATDTGGTAVYVHFVVLSNAAGVVDVSDGVVVVITDTD